jgi:hypothetical protein
MDEQYLSKIQEKKFIFLVEHEKFLNNLEAVRRKSEQISLLTHQLKNLFEELACATEDTRSLKSELNLAASRIDLQPIPAKRINL